MVFDKTGALANVKRQEGASLDDLEAGLHVSVNMTLLPIEAKTFSDINGEDFRRGFAATGSLKFA